jgi:hypothetical protein
MSCHFIPGPETRHPLYRRLGEPQVRSGRVQKVIRQPDRPVRRESSVTGFSDETHFHFDAYINKHSVRIRPGENPRLAVVNPLQIESTVRRASPSVGIISPVFIEGLVSSDCNFSLFMDELSPFMMAATIH